MEEVVIRTLFKFRAIRKDINGCQSESMKINKYSRQFLSVRNFRNVKLGLLQTN